MESVGTMELIWTFLILITSALCMRACNALWLKPYRIRSKLRRQGITGPQPTLLFGNTLEAKQIMKTKPPSSVDQHLSHESWVGSIFPHLQHWSRIYGKVFMFSTENKQHLYITDPQLIKEINLHKSLDLGKPESLSRISAPLLGEGILDSNGTWWSFQRKLIAPHFFNHKIKFMTLQMEDTVRELISQWESKIKDNQGGFTDIQVDEDLLTVAADIISKCCFGSSYLQGKQIFATLSALQTALFRPNYVFETLPILRYLPTKKSREASKLQKEVDGLIIKLINKRIEEGEEHEDDLLQSILVAAGSNKRTKLSFTRFIVDNCKNIYFAGSKTTALAASWCLLLLSLYPEWQERVREEINQVFTENGKTCVNAEGMSKLKVLTMVINETLRLYGPAVSTTREAYEDVKLGDLIVPKGTSIWMLLPVLHRDPDYWGPDANEFKPERFENGQSEASKHPYAYLPYGLGPRICLGMNFAMLELKIIVSLLISKFHFSVSPDYKHSPTYKMVLVPGNGIRLIVKSV